MRALAALFIACLTGPVAAEPRSAIPWLSEVLRTPPAAPGSIVPTASVPPDGPAMPFGVGPITESSLNDPVRDGVGLLAPTETGLPRDLWRGLSALRLRAMINGQPIEGVPGARALYAQMLLAETDPPAGAGPKNGVLLARIDRLMAAGRLAEAEALVDSIGVLDPALFRRAFDIALLTGPVEDRCAQMQAAPPLAPTLPARVFCLARLGDWSAAALTLSLGANVGDVSATEEALLSRFLDPELFEGLPGPDPAPQMTTLDFSLREATALPRPQGPLPLAFEHVDTADGVALRTRLEALERLAREDATPAERLFQAYRSGTPAASGGIWDRMAAAQALDRAFAIADPAPLARAVLAADTLFAQHGLRAALARAYGRQLAALDPTAFDAATSGEIGALLVLAGRRGAAAPWFPDDNEATNRFLTALATGRRTFGDTDALSPLKAAAAAGLSARRPTSDRAAIVDDMIRQGQIGAALMRAIALLAPGTEIDPGDLTDALYILRRAGRAEDARQIAAETLLLLPPA